MKKKAAKSWLLILLAVLFVFSSCSGNTAVGTETGFSEVPLSTDIPISVDKTEYTENITRRTSAEPKQAELPLAVTEPLPDGSILRGCDFEAPDSLKYWNANKQNLSRVSDANGTYLKADDIGANYTGFVYTPDTMIRAGAYRFTGWFRTAVPGQVSQIRVIFNGSNGSNIQLYINIRNEWLKVDTCIDTDTDISSIKVCGGPNESYIQPYCMDNLSLTPVPDTETAGKTVTEFGDSVSPQEAFGSMVFITNTEEERDYKVNGLIINQDADGFLSSCANGSCTVNDIIAFAKQFEGSQITDYMICINNTNASYPSQVWTDVLDKYHQRMENGVPVDYSEESIMKGAHHIYEVLGTDYIALWMTAFREIGINPWLSVRMNDAHDHTQNTSRLLSDFYHEHPEIRRIQHHKNVEYFDRTMDYAQPLVREYVKSLINEALERYDPYGIELDFQREILLFKIGGEYDGIEIMNAFMREIDALVRDYEKKRGHEIRIAVRVASDVDANLDLGLDIMTWVAEGIVDQVSPSGRWSTTDNDMPVRLWSSLLKPYKNVVLAPCIETNVLSHPKAQVMGQTLETMSGAAANILSQGADKVYLFNHYRGMGPVITAIEKHTVSDTVNISSDIGYWKMITTLGSYEKLMTVNRRCILTYDDTYPMWESNAAQLPKTCRTGASAYLRIANGDIGEGKKVTVKLASDTDLEGKIPVVYVNSLPCSYIGSEECSGGYTNDRLYCFEIPENAYSVYSLIEIIAAAAFTVNYAEICIFN